MKDEEVLLEALDDESDKVLVIPFDIENKMVIGTSIEITSRKEAMEGYNVVGEIVCGDIRLHGDEDEEDDYSEYFDGDEDD